MAAGASGAAAAARAPIPGGTGGTGGPGQNGAGGNNGTGLVAKAAGERGWKLSDQKDDEYLKELAAKGMVVDRSSEKLKAELKTVGERMAERGDIVVDFSRYPIGAQLFMVNRLRQTNGRGPDGAVGNPRAANGDLLNPGDKIMRFDVVSDPAQPDRSRVPAKLRELPPLNLAAATVTRRWDMDRQNNVWKINNQ